MAIAELNPIFESIRGAVGDLVLKQYGTKLVISRKPVFRNRRFSPAQKACQEKFRQASRFAKKLMADPGARRLYEEESRLKGKPARSLMIADFLHARLPDGVSSGSGVEKREPATGRVGEYAVRVQGGHHGFMPRNTPQSEERHEDASATQRIIGLAHPQEQEEPAHLLPLDQLFPILMKSSFAGGSHSPVKPHSWLAPILRICPGKSGTWSPSGGGSTISAQAGRSASS